MSGSEIVVLVVRGSATFVERVRDAAAGRARVEACTLRMAPLAAEQLGAAVVVVPEELHGAPATRLRDRGAVVVELPNDAPAELVAERLRAALATG